jgi:hypothetical protein
MKKGFLRMLYSCVKSIIIYIQNYTEILIINSEKEIKEKEKEKDRKEKEKEKERKK